MEYMNRPESTGAASWHRDALQMAGEPSRPPVHPKG